jgi:tetratricopeptide (TPR) repeat protein
MATGDLDDAEIAFVKLVGIRPDDAGARYSLGNALFSKGEYGPAADRFRESIHLNSNFAQAHYNLGMALIRLKDDDAAQMEFNEAHRLDPNLFPPKDNRSSK